MLEVGDIITSHFFIQDGYLSVAGKHFKSELCELVGFQNRNRDFNANDQCELITDIFREL